MSEWMRALKPASLSEQRAAGRGPRAATVHYRVGRISSRCMRFFRRLDGRLALRIDCSRRQEEER